VVDTTHVATTVAVTESELVAVAAVDGADMPRAVALNSPRATIQIDEGVHFPGNVVIMAQH
jgi:hypothetical protein